MNDYQQCECGSTVFFMKKSRGCVNLYCAKCGKRIKRLGIEERHLYNNWLRLEIGEFYSEWWLRWYKEGKYRLYVRLKIKENEKAYQVLGSSSIGMMF